MAYHRKARRKSVGNPLVAMTAAKVVSDNSPAILKGIKTLSLIIVAAGGTYVLVKIIKNRRKTNLMKKAGTVPEVRSAMNLYDAIPAGLKTSQGSLFNPFGFVNDWGNKVALLWTVADTERIINIGKQIYNEKQDLEKVYKYFTAIYGEALYSLLNKAMKPDELAKFVNYSASGTSAGGKATGANKYAVTRIKTAVRKEAKDIPDWKVWSSGNIIATVENGRLIGMTTGNEYFNEGEEITYLGLNVWGSDGLMHKAWVNKTNVEVYDEAGLSKRFNKPDYASVLQDNGIRFTFNEDSLSGFPVYGTGNYFDMD